MAEVFFWIILEGCEKCLLCIVEKSCHQEPDLDVPTLPLRDVGFLPCVRVILKAEAAAVATETASQRRRWGD